METKIQKIKYVCRLQNGTYMEKTSDDIPQDSLKYAEMLLHSFFPEKLTRQLSLETGQEQAVLVFRTDTQQVKEFQELLQLHEFS